MNNKRFKTSFINHQDKRESFGFIVDLRQKTNKEIITPPNSFIKELKQKLSYKSIRKNSKLIKNQVDRNIYQAKKGAESINKRIKSISPNLLTIIKEESRSLAHQGLISTRWSKKISFKKYFKKLRRKRNRVNNYWLNSYQQKTNDFKEALDRGAMFLSNKINKKINIKNNKNAAEKKLLWYRSIFSFLFILILIIVPFKILAYFQFFSLDKLEAKILTSSQSAFSNLLAASDAVEKRDLKEAGFEFKQAADNFLEAEAELDKIGDSLLSLAALSDNPKFKLAAESKKFLRAGAIASSLGHNLVLSTNSLFAENKLSFSEKIDDFSYYGKLAVTDSFNLKNELSNIKSANLPAESRVKFSDLNRQVDLISSNLALFIESVEQFKNILGVNQDKRYLLVFQNNSELRASGGFLGSYALLDIRDGKIKNLEIPGGGSYDTEGGMNVRVVAPRPLWLVNTLWHFWDANWWPDWPKTAKNLMWFYEKSGGPTVDGVISLTPDVIEGLLEITGPIDLQAEYGLVIDSNNFWESVQKIAEYKNLVNDHPEEFSDTIISSTVINSNLPIKQGLENNSNNKPKKIIGDLTIKILEILPNKLNKENLLKILSLFEKNVSAKQILFYSAEETLQKELVNHGWAGEIKDTKGDYLLVVNTNIAGQKSDKKMREAIEHFSEVAINGEIINTVKITRAHTGYKNEFLSGVRNVDWLRVYVPLGSELISANGFIEPDAEYLQARPESYWEESALLKNENSAIIDPVSKTSIYQDDNKTVFANWLMVDPGESQTVIIKYRLPFKFFSEKNDKNFLEQINSLLNPDYSHFSYSLLVQKQPGAQSSQFTSTLKLTPGSSVYWSHLPEIKQGDGWEIKDYLDSDKYWPILLERNKY